MKNNTNRILKHVIDGIKPYNSEISSLQHLIKDFIAILESCLKKRRISAEAFIGGSIAKNTIVKKKRYDIDIFVRFSYGKYKEKEKELGSILENAVTDSFKKFKAISKGNTRFRFEKIHGSRDYFNINFYNKKLERELIIEVVPTLAIKKPQEAKNITDLSSFHVKYVVNGLKKKNLRDDIMLAKAFCFAQGCYGAESHIKGFSGYALELLVIYYGGFEKFMRSASSWKEKVIIDSKKKYKNEQDILSNINAAKLQSPIILIDPTYGIRNVCAAVSKETFARFTEACKNFIKKPTLELFQEHKTDKNKLKSEAIKKNAKLAIVRIKTKKDNEEIAASKILKFSDFLIYRMKMNDFEIIRKEIEFLGFGKGDYSSLFYIIHKNPSATEIVKGPPIAIKEHAEKFKAKYKNFSIKDNRLHAKIKRKIKTIQDIVNIIKKGAEMKDMGISDLKLEG